ncbi:MAG TPA: DUF5941 domain-containing protein [Streptosporangiaceae bacterium]|nr:DUF5941 domain-containing protein [Streptosporangiaceae bacterium]
MTVTTAVTVLPRRMAVWAARRALARNSLTGIELGCYLCAAVWFSAGKPATALAGGAALGGGYLARRIGGQLTVAAFPGWLAVTCAWAGELGVYAGLAAGAAGHPVLAWKLATGAAMLLALRKVTRLCRSVPAGQGTARPAPGPPVRQREDAAGAPADPRRLTAGGLIGGLLAGPAWVRALVITGAAAYFGNRTALLAAVGCAAVALAWSLVAGPHRPRPPAARGAVAGGGADRAAGGAAACRDDGPLARFAGAVVHGQLVPLPPAVAGLAATVLLAALGLGSLDGLVLLTPVAAMLLAAPGSAHPHNGRLDWLAPVVIQAGQYVYLAALGFAVGVPGPITFGLIGLVSLRQLDVAYQAWHPITPRGPRGSLGWEGRMLVAGFSAMVGLGMVGYLALAVYLAWLLCDSALPGWYLAIRS